jgi:hypothetical protein
MRWVEHVACTGDRKDAYRDLVGKSEGRTSLGRPRLRWEVNIKMNIQAVGLRYGLNWFGSGHGQVAGSCVCGDEPSGYIKCRQFFD